MKRLALLGIFFLAFGISHGQYVRQDSTPGQSHVIPPYNFEDHLSVGGSLGLQFGDVTIIGISPLINYHINSSLMVGVGPIYQYSNTLIPGYGDYSASMYGGRVVIIQSLPGALSKLFLMGEYDAINVPDYDNPFINNARATIGIPMLGGGYRQPIGQKSSFTIALLFNFSTSDLSPYTNPAILTGFDFGL